MMTSIDDAGRVRSDHGPKADTITLTEYVKVDEMRSPGDDDTCLRPLGLCELGGSCDSCWYRPDHPRFQNR